MPHATARGHLHPGPGLAAGGLEAGGGHAELGHLLGAHLQQLDDVVAQLGRAQLRPRARGRVLLAAAGEGCEVGQALGRDVSSVLGAIVN